MTTTELIKILQENEIGAISLKPREISLTINGRYMPNPQITLSSTGDGICGAEIDLDINGEWLEQEPKGAELMQLHETLEYGQGYDDDIVDVLKSFQKFRDGYYELINNGDEWWDVFNQGIEFQEIMKKAWEEIEDADIMGNLENMAIAIAGAYIRFDKFVDGVVQAYEDGYGFRHKAESEKG